MYSKDFYVFDGRLESILLEISRWIEDHTPKNPLLLIVEQGRSTIHMQIICDEYDD